MYISFSQGFTMKKLLRSISYFFLSLIGIILITSFSPVEDDGGRIKVYIVNNCSSDVNFRVISPGSATSYTAYDNSKKPMSFMEGTKIYASNGDLVEEITSSSDGKDVVVCD